jgi:excisionase family DNA binding protein
MPSKEYNREYYERTKEKQKAKNRERYAANKEEILAKQKEYHAAWYQRNKARLLELKLKADKDRAERTKAAAEAITVSEAATMLGLSLDTMRDHVYNGKIPASKTPGGHWRINRADVESWQKTQATGAITIKQLGGIDKGAFNVPKGFDIIREYHELEEYSKSFAAGIIPFLLLLGTPGSGKSHLMRSSLGGRCSWIDNHVTTMGLYMKVYEANNRPVTMDDVNHFLKNKIACSLLKALTQTDANKHVSWESPTEILDKREIPREYVTSSPICMIANTWSAHDADMAAIQDRALPVAFIPSAQTKPTVLDVVGPDYHHRAAEVPVVDEFVDFIGEHLCDIPQPSMREYYQGGVYKRAKMDWRKKLTAIWEG